MFRRSTRRPAVSLLAGLCLLACADAGGQDRPPNILLISVDTLRADRINAYGYEHPLLTPHLDALANDGILFESFISASPWTTPAHMSLLTSLDPSAHGLNRAFGDLVKGEETGRFVRLADDHTTLAEVLRASGYRTGAFTGGITVEPEYGFDQGFDHFETSMYKLRNENVAGVLDWIAEQPEPWFVFLHTFEVHAPYLHTDLLPDAFGDFARRYRKKVAGLETEEALSLSARNHQGFWLNLWLTKEGMMQRDFTESLYLAGVRSMDRWIGKIVSDLRARGLYDDTLIVVTSDHGDEFGEHDAAAIYDAHGHSTFDEILRVPLILKLPGSTHAGTRLSGVARGVDLMPTLLEAVGAKAFPPAMQGASLVSWWQHPEAAAADRRTAFSEAGARDNEVKSLRSADYKYAIEIDAKSVTLHGRSHWPERLAGEALYDLRRDPGEKTNLLEANPTPEVIAIADGFREELRQRMARPAPHVEVIELDPEALRRLEALGYTD